jgi:tetratricopeptide (TPR) repeat protein
LLLSNRIALVKKILPAIFLALVVVGLYAPALWNDFVWDDTALVLRDPLIRSWQLIPEAFQHFLFIDATASDFYRPVQRLTYLLDYAAFVFKPAGYHFTSILCHIAATLALLLLGRELLRLWDVEEQKARRLAFLAALAWAIHPVQTAAVAYISGRADPLAAAFGFLGLYCALRVLPAAGSRRSFLLFAAGILFLLSALSKETGLLFPLLWIAILILKKNWKPILPAIVVLLFVGVTYLSLRLPAEHNPPPRLRPPAPLLVRPIVVARAFAEYTGLVLFPIHLHMDRDVESHPIDGGEASVESSAWRELQTLLGVLLILAAIYWMARSRRRDAAVFACLVLAALTYIPVSGIIPLNATIAEHWLYVPLAFLFLAAALAMARLRVPSPALAAVLALWLVFLGARTCLRTFDWKNQRTFLEQTMASGGESVRTLINLGNLEMQEGHFDLAKKHLEAALKKEPNQPLAVISLASLALRQNDFATARELANRAKDLPLVDAQAFEILAILEFKEHNLVQPLRFRLAARTGPANWKIERRYIEVLDQTGATAAAISELGAVLRTQWYRAESWQLLSRLLSKTGATRDAMEALAQAKAYDVHLDKHSEGRP